MFDELGIRRSRMLLEAQTSPTICQLVAEGHGVAVVDPLTAETFRLFGFAVRPFRPLFTFDCGILYPLRRPRSRFAIAFADSVYRKEVKSEFSVRYNDHIVASAGVVGPGIRLS